MCYARIVNNLFFFSFITFIFQLRPPLFLKMGRRRKRKKRDRAAFKAQRLQHWLLAAFCLRFLMEKHVFFVVQTLWGLLISSCFSRSGREGRLHYTLSGCAYWKNMIRTLLVTRDKVRHIIRHKSPFGTDNIKARSSPGNHFAFYHFILELKKQRTWNNKSPAWSDERCVH